MSKAFEAILERQEQEFMQHVRPEIYALATRSERISWDEYSEIRANSYERRLLHKNLTIHALILLTRQCLQEATPPLLKFEVAATYDEAILRELTPMLLERLEEALGITKGMSDAE